MDPSDFLHQIVSIQRARSQQLTSHGSFCVDNPLNPLGKESKKARQVVNETYAAKSHIWIIWYFSFELNWKSSLFLNNIMDRWQITWHILPTAMSCNCQRRSTAKHYRAEIGSKKKKQVQRSQQHPHVVDELFIRHVGLVTKNRCKSWNFPKSNKFQLSERLWNQQNSPICFCSYFWFNLGEINRPGLFFCTKTPSNPCCLQTGLATTSLGHSKDSNGSFFNQIKHEVPWNCPN